MASFSLQVRDTDLESMLNKGLDSFCITRPSLLLVPQRKAFDAFSIRTIVKVNIKHIRVI